jgi:hypothetical protein
LRVKSISQVATAFQVDIFERVIKLLSVTRFQCNLSYSS